MFKWKSVVGNGESKELAEEINDIRDHNVRNAFYILVCKLEELESQIKEFIGQPNSAQSNYKENIDWYNHPNRKEHRRLFKIMVRDCGIQKGDYVKILREPEHNEFGWPCFNSRRESTQKYVGEIYKVKGVTSEYGIEVILPGEGVFVFPPFVLEKINSE